MVHTNPPHHYQHQHCSLVNIFYSKYYGFPPVFLTLNQCIYNVISPIISKYIFLTPWYSVHHIISSPQTIIRLSSLLTSLLLKMEKSLAGKVYDFYEFYEVSWVKFPLRLCLTPSCPEYNVISVLIGPNIGPSMVGMFIETNLASNLSYYGFLLLIID